MAVSCTLPFVGEVPNYEIVDGNMHITVGEWGMCMSLRTFRAGMEKAALVIAEHEARKAEVHRLKFGARG